MSKMKIMETSAPSTSAIRSMTNSSLRRAAEDDSIDQENRSFPSHHDRRQLLLKLIRHQMNSAERSNPLIDAGVGVRRQQRPSRNIDASVQVNKKHENPPEPVTENAIKRSVKVKKHDDDEVSLDLEWTANFDSSKNLSQYRHDYLNAISYLLEDFELHPRNSNNAFIPKTENEKCARMFSTSNLGALPPPPPAKEVHPRMHWTVPHKPKRPIETNSTCNFCMSGASPSAGGDDGNPPIAKSFISKILSSVSLPSFVNIGRSSLPTQYYFSVMTLAILLLGSFMFIYYLSKTVFKFVNEFEWPWSVFMKEPLLKGFIYSANLNLYEEDFDWS